jgi:hypothetical protein
MDAAMIAALAPFFAEVSKGILNIYFANMKIQGKTDEEIDRFFFEEKARFKDNAPSTLPDV